MHRGDAVGSTTATLATINSSSMTSNNRPARVSASKMMMYSRSRQPPEGLPKRSLGVGWRLERRLLSCRPNS